MLSICFFIGSCDDRSGEWNGEIIRTGGVGVSGSDTSFILMAEFFALKGHNVSLVASSCKENTKVNNVTYLKTPCKYTDILVIPPSDEFLNYEWENIKTLIIWCHMQHTFSQESFNKIIKKFPTSKIVVNYMNQFTKRATNIYSPHTGYFINDEFFAPNPLLDNLLSNQIIKIPNSFIFNTSFRRGGEVMLNIFNKLPYENKSLVLCSSYKDELKDLNNQSNIKILNSLDKKTLYENLSRSEYFIYPLVAPLNQGANLHKDTFCCAIAEALANEVIVLTFPVGGLPELYENTLIYLPFPDISKSSFHLSDYHSSASELYSDDFYNSVVSIIEFLNKNPKYKELIKRRGKELVNTKFNINTIGDIWLRSNIIS
jgi:glycosyltransferase involved in cell wall biosynthesis